MEINAEVTLPVFPDCAFGRRSIGAKIVRYASGH